MKTLISAIVLTACTGVASPTNSTTVAAAAYLELTPPVAVAMAGGFTDGGSIGVTLVDVMTNKLHIFEDHSLRTTTGGRIYIADDKPQRGGRLTAVEEGIEIKAAVIRLACDWVRRTVPPEVPKYPRHNLKRYIEAMSRKHAREFILRHWIKEEPIRKSTLSPEAARSAPPAER
jgi:hypothetical protein